MGDTLENKGGEDASAFRKNNLKKKPTVQVEPYATDKVIYFNPLRERKGSVWWLQSSLSNDIISQKAQGQPV